ncbi:hypothetical protein GGX14DRAFT_407695 [Mycena pura]|uniref:Uncharacterized protein n=1 Tax=Mycena pura TaxID=153505 RepID=A0AAD6US12_9AGAR|nr:hypothetical protein GGX14DRAFT_407695 [Mycena pura]
MAGEGGRGRPAEVEKKLSTPYPNFESRTPLGRIRSGSSGSAVSLEGIVHEDVLVLLAQRRRWMEVPEARNLRRVTIIWHKEIKTQSARSGTNLNRSTVPPRSSGKPRMDNQ